MIFRPCQMMVGGCLNGCYPGQCGIVWPRIARNIVVMHQINCRQFALSVLRAVRIQFDLFLR